MSVDIDTLPQAGKVVHGYTWLEDGHEGSNSVWGKAKSPTGQTVFLKKYTTPSIFDPWRNDYIKYQAELKRRIDCTAAKNCVYMLYEFFDTKEGAPDGAPTYYQALEYIDGAKDLADYLQSPDTTWEQRKTFAAVFMYAMKTLHSDEVKIIHADLKPKNILLLPTVNPTNGKSGYKIKIIDMDVSIFSDIRAPWHGYENYIGSPGYYSPEHFTGEIPSEKSDVFTCGLILYELLTKNCHPYGFDRSNDEYLKICKAHAAPVPDLQDSFGSSQKDKQIAQLLHRMLSPKQEDRPSAHDVHALLISKTSNAVPPSSSRLIPPSSQPIPPSSQPIPPPLPPGVCRLHVEASGASLRVFPGVAIGHPYLADITADAAKYYSRNHFLITCEGAKWFIVHQAPSNQNCTAVNGRLLGGKQELHHGDVITAANRDASKTVCPLTVEIT